MSENIKQLQNENVEKLQIMCSLPEVHPSCNCNEKGVCTADYICHNQCVIVSGRKFMRATGKPFR